MSRSQSATYELFGLIVSSDLPIPGLPQSDARQEIPDVSISMGVAPELGGDKSAGKAWYETLARTESGSPTLQISEFADRNLFLLEYFDGLKFWINRAGSRVWVLWPANSSIEVAASYLLGPILGIVLRLRGITCLHGSVANVRGSGVIFIGPPGAGKSTTAAALAQRGHAVLSDDIAALHESDGGFLVLPAYPHLCLWPDSAEMLFQSDTLPRLAADSDKRRLSRDDANVSFQKQPVPLSIIYVLGERESHSGGFVENGSPQSALLSLIANTYAGNLPLSLLRAKELQLWERVLSRVSLRKLRPHADPRFLPELCQAIERDCLETRPIASRKSF